MFKKKQTPAEIGVSGEQTFDATAFEDIGSVTNSIRETRNFVETMHNEMTTVLNTMADRIVALEENRNPELHERNNDQRLSTLEQNVLGGQNLIQSVVSEFNVLITDYTELREKVLLQKKYRNKESATLEKNVRKKARREEQERDEPEEPELEEETEE